MEKEKNEFGDIILIVKIHKDGSVLEDEDRKQFQNYNQYLDPVYKSNCKYYEVRLFLKQVVVEKKLTSGRSEMDRKFIQLSKLS